VGFVVLVLLALAYLPAAVSSETGIRVAVNWAGGASLAAYYQHILPTKEAYPAKGVRKPLLICLLLFIPVLLLLLYSLAYE
jgi:hypothetical protein